MTHLFDFLERAVANYPDAVAISFENHRASYTRLIEAVEKLAQGLMSLGISPGDRVVLMIPNIPQFAISYYAVLRMGGVVVPVNIMFKETELRFILDDCEARAIIAWEGFSDDAIRAADMLDACQHVIILGNDVPESAVDLTRLMAESDRITTPVYYDDDATAVIMYTAGSSGRSKGAELTHMNLISNARTCRHSMLFGPSDRFLAVLPLFHSFGQTVIMHTAFASAGQLFMVPRFDLQTVVERMAEERITVFAGVPTMYHAFLELEPADVDFSSVKVFISGGDALPVDVATGFEEKFGHPIYEGYGLTETSPVVSFNHIDRVRKPGSIGQPVDGVVMKVVGSNGQELRPGFEGEIVVQGPNVMKGYLNRPEANKEVMRGGWFHTGDIGRMDQDGYFYIVGRKYRMIIKGGFNVYPKEVEEALRGHPGIEEAIVIGLQNRHQGEEVAACVVPRRGVRLDAQEIINYARERMAAYKCPRFVHFYSYLPKTSTGTVIMDELKRDMTRRLESRKGGGRR